MNGELRPARSETFRLGEGPLWDPVRRCLLWVDIRQGLVLQGQLDDGRLEVTDRHHFDGAVGAVAVAADGTLLVAVDRGLVVVTVDGTRTPGPALLPPGSRLNDGTTDPAGRFLVGSLSLTGPSARERLVRVESDAEVTVLDDDLQLSNGLAFSSDGRRLFSVDTLRGTVFVRSYDSAAGTVGERAVHLRFDNPEQGLPDGIAVDAADHLWVALWGAGEVRRYTPDGRADRVLPTGAPHTTSVAFAGDDLKTLVVTTATDHLDAATLLARPRSGQVLTTVVDVPGTPVASWSPFPSL